MRTFGAIDKCGSRKTRSDKGKSRKLYRGKPVKTKQEYKTEKRMGNKTHIKIWVWELKQMSRDGYLRINKKSRNKFAQNPIWKPLQVHLVAVEDINTRAKIEEFFEMNYWDGTFVLKGFSNGRNKYRCKAIRKAKVLVKERDGGLHAKMIHDYGLYRYWFWRKE